MYSNIHNVFLDEVVRRNIDKIKEAQNDAALMTAFLSSFGLFIAALAIVF